MFDLDDYVDCGNGDSDYSCKPTIMNRQPKIIIILTCTVNLLQIPNPTT